MSGLTSSGFERRTLEQILSGVTTRLHADIDAALDLSPDQPMGQIVGAVSADLAEAWEVLDDVNASFDPDNAEGVVLDSRCGLTGTIREGATKTLVICTVNLNSATVLNSGNRASVINHSDQVFLLRDTVSNPGVTSASITGTVWEALVTGPTVVQSGTLTQIVTPSAGWNSITNPEAGIPGNNIESDTDLRLRREDEIFAIGGCTVDSLRGDVLRVEGIQQCIVFENTGITTDSNGVPPHAFEVVIYDGLTSDAELSSLYQTIWAGKPAGVGTFGSLSGVTTDSLNSPQTVFYSRAVAKQVFIAATVNTDSGFAGTNAVAEAIATVEDFQMGEDVIALRLRAGAFNATGVVDVPVFLLDFTSGIFTNDANLSIGPREIAFVDVADVVVNVA